MDRAEKIFGTHFTTTTTTGPLAPEQYQENDDRDRNPKKPEQSAFREAHDILR
jgi:hypothetical protein